MAHILETDEIARVVHSLGILFDPEYSNNEDAVAVLCEGISEGAECVDSVETYEEAEVMSKDQGLVIKVGDRTIYLTVTGLEHERVPVSMTRTWDGEKYRQL
jgi:hypothetical protein